MIAFAIAPLSSPWLRRLLTIAGLGVLAVALASMYFRVSSSWTVNSDGANAVLQGADLADGNILLHGWRVSTASFFPAELGIYALLVAWHGASADIVHDAGAVIYMLAVICVALLAKGRVQGWRGYFRSLVAGLLVIAPTGFGTRILIMDPNHTGTVVLLLLAFIVLERLPFVAGVPSSALLLGLAMLDDPYAIVIGAVPLLVVAGIRLLTHRALLQAAVLTSTLLALAASRGAEALIQMAGGFTHASRPVAFAAATDLGQHLLELLEGVLLLFGADFFGQPVGRSSATAALHLIGVALVVWSGWYALHRWRDLDLITQTLLTGVLVNIAAFVFSNQPASPPSGAVNPLDSHYLQGVLFFGSALAGRIGGDRLLQARLIPHTLTVGVAYFVVFALFIHPLQPVVRADNGDEADWLVRHQDWLVQRHLSYGLAGYWEAGVVTLKTGGAVRIRAVVADEKGVHRYSTESQDSWYDPSLHDATFVVVRDDWVNRQQAEQAFGPPARVYELDGRTILAWDRNLLTGLVPPSR